MLCLDLIEEQDSFLADNITQFGDNEKKIQFVSLLSSVNSENLMCHIRMFVSEQPDDEIFIIYFIHNGLYVIHILK